MRLVVVTYAHHVVLSLLGPVGAASGSCEAVSGLSNDTLFVFLPTYSLLLIPGKRTTGNHQYKSILYVHFVSLLLRGGYFIA